METIKLSEFDWIKSNSDLFKKYLYTHHDFIGKRITHININITFPENHLIVIELCKAKKPFKWLTLNISTHRLHFYKTYSRKGTHEPKEVIMIKSEYKEGLVKQILEIEKRDNTLKEILQ